VPVSTFTALLDRRRFSLSLWNSDPVWNQIRRRGEDEAGGEEVLGEEVGGEKRMRWEERK
jgi:hypothetical protein